MSANRDAEYLRELADPRTGVFGIAHPNVDADRIRRIADRIEARAALNKDKSDAQPKD